MSWRDWFKRRKAKKPRFDYAAIRIGNVYVLPPTEEDVRGFRKKRRNEIARRGFIAAGIAAAILTVAYLVWPRGGGAALTVEDLLPRLQKATADPGLLRKLCLEYYKGTYPPEIRQLAITFMRAFAPEQADDICDALWDRVRNDPALAIRESAVDELLINARSKDIDDLVLLYRSEPWSRRTIDAAVEALHYTKLREKLRRR